MNIGCRTWPRFVATLAMLAAANPAAAASAQPVLTNCTMVAKALLDGETAAELDIVATVTGVEDDSTKARMTVCDGIAAFGFDQAGDKAAGLRPGDIVRVRGSLERNVYDEPVTTVSSATVVARGPFPCPIDISPDEFKSGRFDDWFVRISGVVRCTVRDDINPDWRFMVLAVGGQIVYVAQHVNAAKESSDMELPGASVAVTGFCCRNRHGVRRPPYRRIEREIVAVRDGIEVIKPADPDFSRMPEIGTFTCRLPETIPLDERFRVRGNVLAVWNGDTALIRAAAGPIVQAQFAAEPLPAIGDSVDVAGFLEYNLFTFGLSGCVWRKTDHIALPEPSATNVSARCLLEDRFGRPVTKIILHGKTIRMEGVVRSARGEGLDSRMILSSDGYLVPVDAGTNPEALDGIPVGSRVSVTGICVMNIDDWRPAAPFPRIRGFTVVMRSPEDIRVVAFPPWWTPARLTALLLAILAVLCCSVLLNILLKRLVERRRRQLAEEIRTRIESDLKVKERTRLAVELHDAMSQTLTGVALQLQTVRSGEGSLSPHAAKHLAIAEKSLDSCRTEMRNCIWDLRNDTLDCPEMNEAIRHTLSPCIGGAELFVRFDVNRTRFADNFAHALLHIIRELASNAVNHGGATRIRIAGCMENGQLLFSVSDNGCGFDPQYTPGIEEGHFGLIGVRERIEGFDGKLKIDSGPKGTTITAAMNIKPDKGRNEAT